MNPFMNTNEASNNLHRKEQDATHKAAIGKLTEMVRAAQQSTLTELQAENAALKEQVAQLQELNENHAFNAKYFKAAGGCAGRVVVSRRRKSSALSGRRGCVPRSEKFPCSTRRV